VIPIENENLSRSGIDAYVYWFCVEKRAPSHTECLLLHLKRDFPFRYHLYAILFNYPVRNQFRTHARQNWQHIIVRSYIKNSSTAGHNSCQLVLI